MGQINFIKILMWYLENMEIIKNHISTKYFLKNLLKRYLIAIILKVTLNQPFLPIEKTQKTKNLKVD